MLFIHIMRNSFKPSVMNINRFFMINGANYMPEQGLLNEDILVVLASPLQNDLFGLPKGLEANVCLVAYRI